MYDVRYLFYLVVMEKEKRSQARLSDGHVQRGTKSLHHDRVRLDPAGKHV